MARLLISLVLCLFSINLYGAEYRIAREYDLRDNLDVCYWEVVGLGDEGQLIGYYSNLDTIFENEGVFFVNLNKEITRIRLGKGIDVAFSNSKGQILGKNSHHTKFIYVDESYKLQEVKLHSSDYYKDILGYCEIVDMNDEGQFLGYVANPVSSYFSYSWYVWDDNKLTNVSTEISKYFANSSFSNARSVQLNCFNSKGTYVGTFTDNSIPNSTQIFAYRDGQVFVAPTNEYIRYLPRSLMVNNKEKILIIDCNDSFVWNFLENKLEVIPNFTAKKINDNSVVIGRVGYDKNEKPALWKAGRLSFLFDLLDPADVETVLFECAVRDVKIVDVNNHGDLLIGLGCHYYVLTPLSVSEL